jgi:hypothetical protein
MAVHEEGVGAVVIELERTLDCQVQIVKRVGSRELECAIDVGPFEGRYAKLQQAHDHGSQQRCSLGRNGLCKTRIARSGPHAKT